MVSINRNIPTQTTYVPTTTQQPTNTNTTVSSVTGTTDVTTLSSDMIYPAVAPNTQNAFLKEERLEQLFTELDAAKCGIDTSYREINNIQSMLKDLRLKVYDLNQAKARGKCSEASADKEIKAIYREMEYLDEDLADWKDTLKSSQERYSKAMNEIKAFFNQSKNSSINSSTSSYIPTTTTGYIPTTTTAYIPTIK